MVDDAEEGESKAALKLSDALYDSLRTSPKEISSGGPKQEYQFDLAKNLRMVRRAWRSLNAVLSSAHLLEEYTTKFLRRLGEFEDELGELDDAASEWAELCVELILASEDPSSSLSAFWGQVDSKWNWSASVCTTVWTKFVQSWQENKCDTSEGSLALLSIPFCSERSWDLSDEELSTWERFLTYVVNRGFNVWGFECISVVDNIASKIQEKCNPTFTSFARIADMLMASVHGAFQDIVELPVNLMEFVADTLNQSYPPSPSTGFSSTWMIRSLNPLIDVSRQPLPQYA